MHKNKLLFICIFCFFTSSLLANEIPQHHFYINQNFIKPDIDDSEQYQKYKNILASISNNSNGTLSSDDSFYFILSTLDTNQGSITLVDGSVWQIDWWYRSQLNNWHPEDRLEIFFDTLYRKAKIINVDRQSTAWGQCFTAPSPQFRDSIKHISKNDIDGSGPFNFLTLKSGWRVRAIGATAIFSEWKVKDEIFLYHDDAGCSIWNLTQGIIVHSCKLSKKDFDPQRILPLSELLELEHKLNDRVLAQPEAVQAVSQVLLNYAVGLNNPNAPIGVFLFLGPTGVGKTELAKSLCIECYQDSARLIRFDMSQFTESVHATRLIGPTPGLVGAGDGGQLTNPLKKKPKSIVLLDEIEKAHPQVQKFFLPIFDEGYVCEALNNNPVSCKEAIFIMTSNLYSETIAQLFDTGHTPEQVLEKIEPLLIQELSPELYNRVRPIIFHPLRQENMSKLVDLMLKEVVNRTLNVLEISLFLDDSARDYLVEHGFHPKLGARPLKKLIEDKVTATVAYAIAKEGIPRGSSITLFYQAEDDSWHVTWN